MQITEERLLNLVEGVMIENPWTVAHQAVEASNFAELSRLLDAGVDPNEVCCGQTLLGRV